MKIQILRAVVFTVVLSLMSQVTLGAKQEIVVTNAGGDQQVPSVWESIVVFENNQSGRWNISFKDLSNAQSIIRTIPKSGENRNPSIMGNTVVWQSRPSSNFTWDIWAADISDQTNEIVFAVDTSQTDLQHPVGWGNSVIYEYFWEGYWLLRLVDISNPAVPTHSQWFGYTMTDLQYPAIWDDLLFSQYKETGTWEIFTHSAHDPNIAAFFAAYENDQENPDIYGSMVVFQDDFNGDWDVLANNIADPFWHVPICDIAGSDSVHPAIWNNIVVWQDNRNGNWDIYGYNLAMKMEFQITNNDKDQTNPVISFSEELSRYIVVWQDHRNSNWDIYGALLDGAEVAGCASPLKGDINKDCIVDENDVAEIEDHMGERNGISP